MKNFKTILLLFAASSILIASCIGSNSSDNGGSSSGGGIVIDDPNPPPTIVGTTLACDDPNILTSNTAASYAVDGPDSIPTSNVSREGGDPIPASALNANAGNNIKRLSAPVTPMLANGDVDADYEGEPMVHPILVSYTEQVLGTYELGDGSADIGDPSHVDDPFVSVSLNNGKNWKKEQIADTSGSSSKFVNWAGDNIAYPGHSHKMTMGVNGNNILVAWLDKYCPDKNPYDLELVDGVWVDDLYQVNAVGGGQGSIDYDLPCTITDPEDDDYNCAPNGKPVYEVPFSCVWAARGVFDPADGSIMWRIADQVTSGIRDANKITIASEDIGFIIAWQEDPLGLRSGGAAGPGAGWSGATTNHGADIWYTRITMDDFDDVIIDDQGDTDPSNDVVSDDPTLIAGLGTKPKTAVNFVYPVRITDNAKCNYLGDSKLYCEQVCTDSTTVDSNNQKDQDILRCLTGDIDPIYQWDGEVLVDNAYAALDGDTGASRPAITMLKTDADEYLTVLAYEETKGLSDAGGSADDIALEGKVVLAEAFLWDQPVTISAGNVVNVKVPSSESVTSVETDMIYENARRVVIIKQVDPCEMTPTSYPIGFMYKQSFETQGGASDMYVRMVRGTTVEALEDVIYNVSGQSTSAADASSADVDSLSWSEENMDDYPMENPYDNTFSPRAFMRGDEIYTGFAYTPSGDRTEHGMEASNFWIHRMVDDGDGDGLIWQGPQQVSFEQGGTSALDPRFVPTAPYNAAGVLAGMESDRSNPSVLLMSYGTADSSHELDVYYARSTDKGMTFEYVIAGSGTITHDPTEAGARFAKLSAWPLPVEEKEVQLLASPDGNMGFNVWLQESEVQPDEDGLGDGTLSTDGTVTIPDNFLGLESWLGRVDWIAPVN